MRGAVPFGISYHSITPALFFTTSITWAMGPVAFWPRPAAGQTVRMVLGGDPDTSESARSGAASGWEAGRGETRGKTDALDEGLPIRIFIFSPFIALLLVMVGATAIVAPQRGR
jgi:hypothetical protein